MFRILLIIGLGSMLGGCESLAKFMNPPQIIVQDKYIVVAPPDSMYSCPQLANLPKPETLTDLEVARLIVRLDENNKVCGASMASLKQFYTNAKRRFKN